MADLSVNIGKLAMKNPVMTASGTFGYGLEFQDFVNLEEIGGIIVKGTTLHHREGKHIAFVCHTGCREIDHTIGRIFISSRLDIP